MKLLVRLAAIYEAKGKLEDAIFVLEHIMRQLEQSAIKLEDRFRSSMLVLGKFVFLLWESKTI